MRIVIQLKSRGNQLKFQWYRFEKTKIVNGTRSSAYIQPLGGARKFSPLIDSAGVRRGISTVSRENMLGCVRSCRNEKSTSLNFLRQPLSSSVCLVVLRFTVTFAHEHGPQLLKSINISCALVRHIFHNFTIKNSFWITYINKHLRVSLNSNCK